MEGMRCDHGVPGPEKMSRDELVVFVGEQAERIRRQQARLAGQDAQIAGMATQIADLVEANEELAAKLARLEHLLSRNSRNSSSPPSKDDDAGRMAPPDPMPRRGGGGPKRKRGKQPGAPGTNLAWTDTPDARTDRFPTGRCDCGHDLGEAADLGVADRYQQHEIPQVVMRVCQYDQHRVHCRCRKVHTAARPEGPAPGAPGTDPTCRRSPSTSWSCTSFLRTAAWRCWSR